MRAEPRGSIRRAPSAALTPNVSWDTLHLQVWYDSPPCHPPVGWWWGPLSKGSPASPTAGTRLPLCSVGAGSEGELEAAGMSPLLSRPLLGWPFPVNAGAVRVLLALLLQESILLLLFTIKMIMLLWIRADLKAGGGCVPKPGCLCQSPEAVEAHSTMTILSGLTASSRGQFATADSSLSWQPAKGGGKETSSWNPSPYRWRALVTMKWDSLTMKLRARTSQGCSLGHRKIHHFLPAHFFSFPGSPLKLNSLSSAIYVCSFKKALSWQAVIQCQSLFQRWPLRCLLPFHLSSAPSCVLWSFCFSPDCSTAKSELMQSSNYCRTSSDLLNGNLPSPNPFALLLLKSSNFFCLNCMKTNQTSLLC